MSLPFFVITFEISAERCKAISKGLGAEGLDPIFIQAQIDGAESGPEAYEVARHRAHRSVYQRMVEDDIAAAVILEEDAVLETGFSRLVARLEPLHDLADMFRFAGWEKKPKGRLLIALDEHHTLDRLQNTPPSLVGYLLTLSGARKALSCTERINLPIDVAIGRAWANGIDQLAVTPFPVTHVQGTEAGSGPPRLGPQGGRNGRRGACLGLRRVWREWVDTFARRGYFLLKVGQDARTARIAVDRIGHVEPFGGNGNAPISPR